MTIATELELGAGDVDSVDGPVGRQERQVFSRSDPDFEPTRGGLSGTEEMTQDFHAGAADAALEDQEALFPGAELDPAGAVVECGDDAISPRERADRLEDAVAHGVFSRAARTPRLSIAAARCRRGSARAR